MPPYFDIKTLPPYTKDCIATRSINLMCAILKGIKYGQLYTQPFHDGTRTSTLNRIIKNIDALDSDLQVGATGNSPIVIPTLADKFGAFVRLRMLLETPSAPLVVLGPLYYERLLASPLDPKWLMSNAVVTTLESVHSYTNDQMFHFCVPFRAIQLGRRTTRPTKSQFESFIRILGHKTLQDFYDQPYTDEERRAAIGARQAGILKEIRPVGSRPPKPIFKIRDGNRQHCVNTVCCGSNDDDTWCSQVNVGGNWVCSLGSDTGTQCYPLTKAQAKRPAAKKSAVKKK